jgi:DNA (cytosine-5)-methyltransferase 1
MPESIIDLYCGAGGLSLGFKSARFKLIYAVDKDQDAVDHYNRNVEKVAVNKDIWDLESGDLPESDGIIGGPPCQAFSLAGRRLAKDPRRSLSLKFAEIVIERTPKFFVMENVDGLFSTNLISSLLDIFDKKYRVEVKILDAVDYGVAQFRKRPFLVGFLDGNSALGLFPKQLPPDKRKTVRQVLKKYEYEWFYRMPRHYGRKAVYSVDEPSPTIRTANRPMPSTYRRHPKDAPFKEGQVRALTPEERAMIQSFSPSYKWLGTKTKKELLIGNAVPPRLAWVIANSINSFIERAAVLG